ncbi:hypothetical protein AgCh_025362 [Apium graveolens]
MRVGKFEPFLRDPHIAVMSSGSGGEVVWISRTAEMDGDMRSRIPEPRYPQYVEDDEFVDNIEKNEEFINLDEDFVDVEEDESENELENDYVEGEDEDDNVNDANMYQNVDGNGVPYMNHFFQILDEAGHFFWAYALRNGLVIKIQATHRNKENEIYGRLYVCRLSGKRVVADSSKNKRRREVLPKSECKARIDERKKRFDISDAQAGLDLLHRLNEESGSKCFIRTKVDEEKRLKCLVWIDPRCLVAYQNFEDVSSF